MRRRDPALRFVVTLASSLSVVCLANSAAAGIITGPIINPANGHTYFLLDGAGWLASEAEAVTLGGHLVTVNDVAEDAWVSSTFFPFTTGQGNLWVGLNDAAVEGAFVWVSGELATYTNWAVGEPNNLNNEDYAHIFGPGRPESPQWNDFNESGIAPIGSDLTMPHGVVEVAIPEPSTLTLVCISTLTILGYGWRRQKRLSRN